jgi:hypothetical protein
MPELCFCQSQPTPIYEYNEPTIKKVNGRIPTECSRHIDIQYFAILDWKAAVEIVLYHIPSVINTADDLTNPLRYVLHLRHVRHIMGHF